VSAGFIRFENALDDEAGRSILAPFPTLCRDHGKAVIVVTHNSAIKRRRPTAWSSRRAITVVSVLGARRARGSGRGCGPASRRP